MLTTHQAQAIVDRWKDRFPSPDALVSSYDRYEARIPAPNRSADGLERWFSEDCEQQFVRAAVVSRLDVKPEHPSQNLPELVDDCPACRGKRVVRRDRSPGQADFGQLLRCPRCNGQPTGATLVSTPETHTCSSCGLSDAQLAGPRCHWPRWHLPNWTSGDFPSTHPVPGWKSVGDVTR